MSRPRADIDPNLLLDAIQLGYNTKEIASKFNVSVPTIRERITELQKEQQVILEYRKFQSLHITEKKRLILDELTEERIQEASFKELLGAYKVLNDAEVSMEGKTSGNSGLVAILLAIEKETQDQSQIIEGKVIEDKVEEGEWSPI
jgi:DNA-binding Lrp family transcriptional regulator